MTDTKLLNEFIAKSGLKKRWIAETMGLSPYGLTLKINNTSKFYVNEVQLLCHILNITSLKDKERIFFADYVA